MTPSDLAWLRKMAQTHGHGFELPDTAVRELVAVVDAAKALQSLAESRLPQYVRRTAGWRALDEALRRAGAL